MKYLLDTNICIWLMKRVPSVLHAFRCKKSEGAAISSIVLAELEYGVQKSQNADISRAALSSFLATIEVLPFDEMAAYEYGGICLDLQRRGKPIGQMDMLVAAHAVAAGLTLVTNNTREFERVKGLPLEDWLSP